MQSKRSDKSEVPDGGLPTPAATAAECGSGRRAVRGGCGSAAHADAGTASLQCAPALTHAFAVIDSIP